jgi:hypothetical protein
LFIGRSKSFAAFVRGQARCQRAATQRTASLGALAVIGMICAAALVCAAPVAVGVRAVFVALEATLATVTVFLCVREWRCRRHLVRLRDRLLDGQRVILRGGDAPTDQPLPPERSPSTPPPN